jgi:hypothetical protein
MMDLGRTGIWSFELRLGDAGKIRDAAAELDEMGWGALWIPGWEAETSSVTPSACCTPLATPRSPLGC